MELHTLTSLMIYDAALPDETRRDIADFVIDVDLWCVREIVLELCTDSVVTIRSVEPGQVIDVDTRDNQVRIARGRPAAAAPQAGEDRSEHSRRFRELLQKTVLADRAAVGRVVDAIVDDDQWQIHYLVIERLNYDVAGVKVLLRTKQIDVLKPSTSSIVLQPGNTDLAACPKYERIEDARRDYAARLSGF